MPRGGKRDGAGRKPFGVTKKVSITLDSEMWWRLESIVELEGVSKSSLIRDMITSYMNGEK